MAESGVLASLMAQLEWHWENHLWPRLAGLTDDEYFWEPAPGCWSVREKDGRFVPDGDPRAVPGVQTSTPPFTNIAWRLCHLGGDVFRFRASAFFGDGSVTAQSVTWPGTAKDALEFVESGYDTWRSGIASLGEEHVWDKLGPKAGPYADDNFIGLILHHHREAIHHGAEVCLLRDLYEARDVGAGH